MEIMDELCANDGTSEISPGIVNVKSIDKRINKFEKSARLFMQVQLTLYAIRYRLSRKLIRWIYESPRVTISNSINLFPFGKNHA